MIFMSVELSNEMILLCLLYNPYVSCIHCTKDVFILFTGALCRGEQNYVINDNTGYHILNAAEGMICNYDN